MKKSICSLMASLVAVTAWSMASNAEHPHSSGDREHPGATEHFYEEPDYPASAGGEMMGKGDSVIESDAALDEVAQFIRDYVKNEEPKGKVKIEHPETGEMLELTLEKVHRERLARINKNKYFVCADFKGPDGTLYDLDFFVRQKGEGQFELIKGKKSLHKVAGEARYTWHYDEDAGVWKKKHSGHAAKSKEHPAKTKEHPAGGHENPEHPQ